MEEDMGKFKQIDIELKSLEEETNQTIHQHTLKTVDAIFDIVNTKHTSEDEQDDKGEL
tara:strand:+ start:403 stop:576 length:174 start_codon:yes stop_codon:yes gene_type:complete